MAMYNALEMLRKLVRIDGGDVVGVVTAVSIRSTFDGHLYQVAEVSWLHNGDPKCTLIEPWRLELIS